MRTGIEGSTRGPRGPRKRQEVEKIFVEGRTCRQGGSGEKEMELKHFTKVEEGGKEKFFVYLAYMYHLSSLVLYVSKFKFQ